MTDWELGNEIMCGPVDRLKELAFECSSSRPQVSQLLMDLALDLGPLVNRLMNDSDDTSGLCPCREEGDNLYYMYFDGTSKKIYDKYSRSGG